MLPTWTDNLAVLLAARSGDANWVFGLIFIGIWLVFGIISTIAKKQAEARREAVRTSLSKRAPTATAKPPPQPPRPVLAEQIRMRIPNEPRPRAEKQQQRAVRKAVQLPARLAPPPLPSPVVTVPTRHMDIAATEIRSDNAASTRNVSSATADSIHKWMTPATLQRQFILTEILQAPIALRGP